MGVSPINDEKLDKVFEAWKTTIEVQQHFNSMEMQVRNFAVTAVGIILGAARLTEAQKSNGLIYVALIIWFAFYLMDRWWYHRMLKGSVNHAIELERKFKDKIPGIGLSTEIGKASPFKIFGIIELHSDHKIDVFYGLIALTLILLRFFA